jgi:hypothetical protein
MGIHNTALIGASGQGGYFINNSVRLRSSASAYLNRTHATTTSRTIWTVSFWVKRGILSSGKTLIGGSNSATNNGTGWGARFQAGNTLHISAGGGVRMNLVGGIVYRDPSAWYHIVFSVDTTQATAANRFRVYFNNVEQTTWATNSQIAQNEPLEWNSSTAAQYIGTENDAGVVPTTPFDGYYAEFHSVDGQQLTPSSFGETDTLTGQWVAKKYTGTYGTNGFYLKFADTSDNTAATIGKDSSGNGNNWTPNNISKTAGVTYDFMTDSPTVGPLASNYAVMSPLIRQGNSSTDFTSDGNLKYTVGANGGYTSSTFATIPMTSGKWYAEVYINAAVTAQWVGVCSNLATAGLGTYGSGGARNPGYAYKVNTGNKCNNDNTGTAYAASSTTGDIIGIAMDADAGSITFYKNGTSLGVAYTGMTNTGNGWLFGSDSDPNGSFHWNFGQRPFSYTQPSGYLALNTYNLSAPTIRNGAQYMAATTYTGTGATQVVTNTVNGTAMQPDFLWQKSRSAARDHRLIDTVRGIANTICSDLTQAEYSGSILSSVNSNGFTLNTADQGNNSAETYVAWQWKAGGGTSVTNTSGTISSQVSANPTAGFSVVTYTGTNTAATVGHGLGVAPSMIIVKQRNSAVENWLTYHSSLTNPTTSYLYLNSTAGQATTASYWNGGPTSSVFGIGAFSGINASAGTYVAYIFAAVAGYSAFGSYTGNGSTDGPFVFLGFRPRFVLFRSTSARNWVIRDTARDTFNISTKDLYPDINGADGAGDAIDLLSNGFKLRATGATFNGSGEIYTYSAFAENPFKYSNAR